VDEFSQFARMPAPKAVPTPLHPLLDDTLALYNGLFAEVRIERRYADDLPLVRMDPEQIRRVVINLIDNAVEAMERRGHITVETSLSAADNLVGSSSPTTGQAYRSAIGTSCFCRISRPSAGAAASAWRSCDASSPSTAGHRRRRQHAAGHTVYH
jgi:signal transduction histidine kinase